MEPTLFGIPLVLDEKIVANRIEIRCNQYTMNKLEHMVILEDFSYSFNEGKVTGLSIAQVYNLLREHNITL